MQSNELMLKKIEKNTTYFDNIYSNRDKFKSEWAFEDAQSRLDGFVKKFKCSSSCCKETSKSIDKKMKRSSMISRIFKNLQLSITVLETLISVVFVLLISEISHSVDMMIESHMLSFYFLGIFALIKVLFENNIIRPMFQRLSWRAYRYSYQTIYKAVAENLVENPQPETIDVNEELELSYGYAMPR